MVALCIEGINSAPVVLEPDIIYRVGRRLGMEVYIDNESIELAHATIVLITGGIVRIAAVNGNVYVNGLKTGFEVKSIREADAINGLVELRFGNVPAKLRFEDGKRLLNDSANDTSGFEEGAKDKSINTTTGSLIPESEPQTANNTVNMESFVVPETQAFCLDRSVQVNKPPKISLGEDCLIPETQDVMLNVSNVSNALEQQQANEDEGSEFGTQIRICTQDFNEFNEDAIDDFDSSLLVGDKALATLPPIEKPEDVTGTDLEMSALNWSATNSKCTALNSTKADATTTRGQLCITPDLSVAGQQSEEPNNLACTPDIFDMLEAEQEKQGSCTPDLDLPTAALSSISSAVNIHQAVTNMETPDSTPADPLENSPNLIAMLAFPGRRLSLGRRTVTPPKASKPNTEEMNEDFIATQAFPRRLPQRESKDSDDNLEDFIATQAFIIPQTSEAKSNGVGPRLSITAQVHSHNEDLIETQAFPTKKTSPEAILDAKLNGSENNVEDFIATQAFIKPAQKSFQAPNKQLETILNISANIEDCAEDMIETQLFISPKGNGDKVADKRKSPDCLEVSGSIKTGDEYDKVLSQLIACSALDDWEQSFCEPEENTAQLLRPTVVVKNLKGPMVDKKHSKQKVDRKRSSPPSESPEVSAPKKPHTSKTSKSTASAELETEDQTPILEKRVRQKRQSVANEDPPSKKTRGKTPQPTVDVKSESSAATKQKEPTTAPKRGRPRGSNTSTQETEEHTAPKRGRPRGSNASTQESEEPTPPKRGRPRGSLASTHESEEPSKDNIDPTSKNKSAKKSTLQGKEPIKENSDSRGRTKGTRTKKEGEETVKDSSQSLTASKKPKEENKSSEGKETTSQEIKPAARRTRRQTQLFENHLEDKKTKVFLAKEDDGRTIGKKDKSPKVVEIVSKTVWKHKSETEEKKKEVKGTSGTVKASRRKPSPEPTQYDLEERPTTSSNARRMNARRSVSLDPLKVINDYIKKIKVSGRKIRLALSMCNYSELKDSVLAALKNAIEVTSDPLDCDLLIMDKGERTYKFLVSVAANKPILSTQWLRSMKANRSIVVQADHIFQDKKFEEMFKFKPLSVFEKPGILKGLHFMLGASIMPSAQDMKNIIESAGGTVYAKAPPIASKITLYAVASNKDKQLWQLLRNYKNTKYIKTEAVMQTLVQHNLELLDVYTTNFLDLSK